MAGCGRDCGCQDTRAALTVEIAGKGTAVTSDWPVTIVKGQSRRSWWSRYPWLTVVVWALFAGQDLWQHQWKAVVFLGIISAISVGYFALGFYRASRD